jgi:hypothetical protein
MPNFMFSSLAAMLVAGLIAFVPPAMAIEEAPYKPIETQGAFELREYAPYVVAETYVEGDFDSVGNEGFRRLVRYIGGDNRAKASIAMTAPVEQSSASQKIAMTAPVEQARSGDRWRVAFVLPASYTLENAPLPNDARVKLAEMPPRLMASVRYSGRWTEENYARNLAELEAWIKQRGLVPAGEPVWARYNPPMMPWFLRRNEILIPVKRA